MKYVTFHLLLIGSFCWLAWLACHKAVSNPVIAMPEPVDTVKPAEPKVETDTLKSVLTLDYVMGKFVPSSRSDFALIDTQYADKAGMYLRQDAYQAFIAMYNHALKDGIRLQIKSATRNFESQKVIWEGKWTGERLIETGENLAQTTPDPKERALKILRYSSMPGSSRHHWGTDVDLNNLENGWFAEGPGLNMYKWLKENAHIYGFCQPYTAGRPFGYFEERWHWSYEPVASKLTAFATTHLKNEMISGFLGSETAPMIDIVHRYVLGINEECNRE